MSDARDPWLETRTSLLERLRDVEDAATWEDFCDVYGRVIYGVARKAGLGPEDIKDVVQDTLIALSRQIGDFRYDSTRGKFKSWLLTIARRRIADAQRRYFRVKRLEPPSSDHTSGTSMLMRVPDDQAPDMEALLEEEWRRELYSAALERVRSACSPRQFQIFDLCVLREFPVEKVAAMLNVTPNQIYVAKHRVSQAVAKEAERLSAGDLTGTRPDVSDD